MRSQKRSIGVIAGVTISAVICLAFVGTALAATINGTAGADDLKGTSGADTLNGLGGADYFKGSAGNDVYYGGTGADYMEDASGNDTFYSNGGAGNGADDMIAAKRVNVSCDGRVCQFNWASDGSVDTIYCDARGTSYDSVVAGVEDRVYWCTSQDYIQRVR